MLAPLAEYQLGLERILHPELCQPIYSAAWSQSANGPVETPEDQNLHEPGSDAFAGRLIVPYHVSSF